MLEDAARTEAEGTGAALQSMKSRADAQWSHLYAKGRAQLDKQEKMSLGHMAARIGMARAFGADGDQLLALIKKATSREQTGDEWVSEIEEQNKTSDPKKVPWRIIVAVASEAAQIAASTIDQLAATAVQTEQRAVRRLKQQQMQLEHASGITAGENTTLKTEKEMLEAKVAALEAKLAEREEEAVQLRAQLVEARASVANGAPPTPKKKQSGDGEAKKKRNKDGGEGEKKKKKRPVDEDAPVSAPKKTSTQESKPPVQQEDEEEADAY